MSKLKLIQLMQCFTTQFICLFLSIDRSVPIIRLGITSIPGPLITINFNIDLISQLMAWHSYAATRIHTLSITIFMH